MAKLLHILVAVATLACLLDEALGRRMSLRAKRKKVLRQMLEREARLRNDTLMQRLLYEESSKYQKDAANKPKYPSDYGDLSHYTLPPHVERHDNDSVDVSEWVREIVTDLTTKPTKRPKTSTLKRNRTTSKYKKKLAQRSPTTADPEALERLRNSTTLSFFDLTPPELIEDTIFPFPVEDLDPNYYTYKSKAWTTTNSTNVSATDSAGATHDSDPIKSDYNDFDNPSPIEDIDRTISQFHENLNKLVEIEERFEQLSRVVNKDVDKTNKNRIKNLIMKESRVEDLNEKYGLVDDTGVLDETVDDQNVELNEPNNNGVKESNGATRDDINEIHDEINHVFDNDVNKNNEATNVKEHHDVTNTIMNNVNDIIDGQKQEDTNTDITSSGKSNEIPDDSEELDDQTSLIDDILSKYCRENATVFEADLKNDAYYNTLRSVIQLFVKEIIEKKNGSKIGKGEKDLDNEIKNEVVENDKEQGNEIKKEISEKSSNLRTNDEQVPNEVDKIANSCDELEELSTMKPLIHRKNELDKIDVSTVEMNIVTQANERAGSEEKDGFGQKNVADVIKDMESKPTNIQDTGNNEVVEEQDENVLLDSSLNDKVVAETLLNNKIKQEIKRINKLVDEINKFNKSYNYQPIQIGTNDSLHQIVEKLRSKRNTPMLRLKRSNGRKEYVKELMNYVEEYEQMKKRKKRELSKKPTQDPEEKTLELGTVERPEGETLEVGSLRKPIRLKRSKSEEDYEAREAVKRNRKARAFPKKVNEKKVNEKKAIDLTSKEKYYYPKVPTHDPGDELWKMVKKDYETNPEVRRIVDTEHSNVERFNSRMWNCKNRSPEDRKKRSVSEEDRKKKSLSEENSLEDRKKRSVSEEAYYEMEYKKKMKADCKKRVLDDESPETTEGTTPDLRWLDISRSKPKVQLDPADFGLGDSVVNPKHRPELDDENEADIFRKYDPNDPNFCENLEHHRVRRNVKTRHNIERNGKKLKAPRVERSLLMDKLLPGLGDSPNNKLNRAEQARYRRFAEEGEARPHLSYENIEKAEYDMYHGLKYGVTEVFEGQEDLTGMYPRYTAASVGPYQKRRYEKFRQYYLAATSTFRDPFIKVSFAVCPFCGDYFGNREKLLFHENYDHFNIFSTVVPVTFEPTPTVSKVVKDMDINDIFEEILKDDSLARASEKWGDFIDANINPTKRNEYKDLLFNESITAFLTVPVHMDSEAETVPDENVKVVYYPSEYHKKENYSYPRDLSNVNRSIPVVNMYENPEKFMKKIINHEPVLPEEKK
ncbi:hypothetical protein M8J75_013940 [Diaphorina citri]|nr:hypothetical protein M8J75_013940 [Diaphorina citri]